MNEQQFREIIGEAVRENAPVVRTKGIEARLRNIGILLLLIFLTLLPVGILAGEILYAQYRVINAFNSWYDRQVKQAEEDTNRAKEKVRRLKEESRKLEEEGRTHKPSAK